jgi:hypothetical protein
MPENRFDVKERLTQIAVEDYLRDSYDLEEVARMTAENMYKDLQEKTQAQVRGIIQGLNIPNEIRMVADRRVMEAIPSILERNVPPMVRSAGTRSRSSPRRPTSANSSKTWKKKLASGERFIGLTWPRSPSSKTWKHAWRLWSLSRFWKRSPPCRRRVVFSAGVGEPRTPFRSKATDLQEGQG